MKRKNVFWYVAMVLFTLVLYFSCDNGNNSTNLTDDQTIEFTSDGYTLRITEKVAKAVFTPKTGDGYEIRNSSGSVISSGTITLQSSGYYLFTPASGVNTFTGELSNDGNSFQITSTITLDNGSQLSGLSLSNNAEGQIEETIYNSYIEAASAGFLYHNGTISQADDGAWSALMKTLDYTRIRINSNTPVSDFIFDFASIKAILEITANDYYKWDIQYNDHRILAQYYDGNGYSYTLVNEVLLLPPINGNDYLAGYIPHEEFEYAYGVPLPSSYFDALYTDISINGDAPVDNLGFLQWQRILTAVRESRNIDFHPGDYVAWKITYLDSVWTMKAFVETISSSGNFTRIAYDVQKQN